MNSTIVNAVSIYEPSELKDEVRNHFAQVSRDKWKHRPKLQPLGLNEKWAAISNCDAHKTPRPDRYKRACIKKCWGVMKNDISLFMKEFHSNGKLVRGLNSSFIELIPKIDNPIS